MHPITTYVTESNLSQTFAGIDTQNVEKYIEMLNKLLLMRYAMSRTSGLSWNIKHFLTQFTRSSNAWNF